MTSFDRSDEAKSRKASLFLISTGTLSTAHLPFWLNWLFANRPNYSVTVGLTETAKQFVSTTAVTALTGTPTVANTWSTANGLEPVHTRIANDHDGIIVYPASVNFLSSLAAGSGAGPFTLGVLGARVPVIVCPSFPPDVADNQIIRDVLARISSVPNYLLVRGQKSVSRSVDRDAHVAAPLWDAISAFESALSDANEADIDADQTTA
ncbi:flavoprotein [Nocardiopsis rhodophaea]